MTKIIKIQVEYGLCDIQGNTFNSLGGKPFLALQPLSAEQVCDDYMILK